MSLINGNFNNDDELKDAVFHFRNDQKYLERLVEKYPTAIQFIHKPSVLLQKLAVGMTWLGHSSIWTRTIPRDAIRIIEIPKMISNLDPIVAQWVLTHPSGKVAYLHKFSKTIQKWAINCNALRISEIPNPSEKLQMLAVNKIPSAIFKIENPSEPVRKRALMSDPSVAKHIKLTPALVKYLLTKNGNNLQYIKDPSRENILMALSKSGSTIKLVKDPDNEMMELAVSKSAMSIAYIPQASDQLKIKAITKAPTCFHLIKDPSIEVCWAALYARPNNIIYIKNKSIDMENYVALVK